MILLVDNYDSFTYNLAQFLGSFEEVVVARNDAENLVELAETAAGIVFSPGPGEPKDAGRMEELIAAFAEKKPLLGICLGHQAMGEVFGGKVVLADKIRHGKVSQMALTDAGQASAIFGSLEPEIPIMRYHSLVIEADSFPEAFVCLGYSTDDHEIMAMKHKELPVYGLQFHPESIGTPAGMQMIENFVKIVKGAN